MATVAIRTIRDLGVTLATKSKQVLVVDPITFPTGRTLAEWSAFTLTVREDPDWNADYGHRIGPDVPAARYADPEGEGWVVAMTLAGTVVDDTIEFPISEADSDVAAGLNRYSFDVWGSGGSAGAVELVAPCWLTFRVRDKART